MVFTWQQNLLYLNIYKYSARLVFPKIYFEDSSVHHQNQAHFWKQLWAVKVIIYSLDDGKGKKLL